MFSLVYFPPKKDYRKGDIGEIQHEKIEQISVTAFDQFSFHSSDFIVISVLTYCSNFKNKAIGSNTILKLKNDTKDTLIANKQTY
jgi:hypothetical protein